MKTGVIIIVAVVILALIIGSITYFFMSGSDKDFFEANGLDKQDYIITENIGIFNYVNSWENEISDFSIKGKVYTASYYTDPKSEPGNAAAVDLYVFNNKEEQESYFDKELSKLYTETLKINNKKMIGGREVYELEEANSKTSFWRNGRYIVLVVERKDRGEIFDAYFNKYG